MTSQDPGTAEDLPWREANDLVAAMAADATTAQLSNRQRQALHVVLGLLNRSRAARASLHQEICAAHAERKRLRKALDDMRQERDRERKRADRAGGRPGCGKIPLGSEGEAQRFIELTCARTGEATAAFETYPCRRGCVTTVGMTGAWHIGHVTPRALREQHGANTGADDGHPR